MSENVQAKTPPTPTPTPTPKITAATATKTEKVKDPKRVEQGKRLAAISKAAKERKARERMQAEIDEASWNIDYGLVFGVVGSLIAVAAVYYASRGASLKEGNPSPRGSAEGKPLTPAEAPPGSEGASTSQQHGLESLD